MKRNDIKLALCDTEQEYVLLFAEYLKRNKDLPWAVHAFSSVNDLLEEGLEQFAFFVIAESLYGDELQDIDRERLLLLSESGLASGEELPCVDKYQSAEEVLREILLHYAEIADKGLPRLRKSTETRFIGIFSPVRRTLQTPVALAMGQLLAENHSVLYLNFEPFAGIGALLPNMQTYDLADLLYFLDASPDKFRLRMRTILRRMDKLEYIPPMKNGQTLLTVTRENWLRLLQCVSMYGEYEYVVLDLSESIQGLFDILRLCSSILTLTKEDKAAEGKLLQYQTLLENWEYDDVRSRTRMVGAPRIRDLPSEPGMLTRGELADFVRTVLEEIENADE